MRQITAEVTRAFEQRREFRKGNSRTDGNAMFLFNNRIAEWRSDGLWISNAGWSSSTTKERLNGLTGVRVHQRAGIWYLNNRYWDGSWVNVDAHSGAESWIEIGEPSAPQQEQEPDEVEFDTTSEWNGKCSVPKYAVYQTHVEAELSSIEFALSVIGVPTRRMYSDTDGEYKPNHFIVVPVDEFERTTNFMTKVSVEAI